MHSYLELPAQDFSGYEIIHKDLPASLDYACRARDSGGSVLVHCYGGVNRSGAIVIALLMLLERMTLLDATSEVVTKRGFVFSNESFRRQLVILATQEQLLGDVPPLDTHKPSLYASAALATSPGAAPVGEDSTRAPAQG